MLRRRPFLTVTRALTALAVLAAIAHPAFSATESTPRGSVSVVAPAVLAPSASASPADTPAPLPAASTPAPAVGSPSASGANAPSASAPSANAPSANAPSANAPSASAPSASAPSASAPLPSTSPGPSVNPAGSTAASKAETAGGVVRIHDRRVFAVLVPRLGRTAEQRAASAGQALERVVEEAEAPAVRVDEQGNVAIVYAGTIPIIQLGIEDAVAAGDVSLAVHADAIASKSREALRAERQRSAIAQTVFSFSLVVFSALVAFLLLRKLDELVEKLRGWMGDRPDRLPALKVRGIEVVRPLAVRGGAAVALTIAKRLMQIGVVYGWVIISLSLFESTRAYTQRLTGFVLTPLSALMGRVAAALPVVVIAVMLALIVGGALRFVRLFLGTVARGETTVSWLPRDLAPATSILVRAGIVVVTLVVAAPLLTGTDDGAVSRVGVIALAAIGVAATPLLCTATAGVAVMFGQQLCAEQYVSVGGRVGRIRRTTLLEIVLEDDEGCIVRVPHILTLWHPTRILGAHPPVSIEIGVANTGDLGRVLRTLEEAAATIEPRTSVELISLGIDGARFRVTARSRATVTPRDTRNRLYCTLAAALAAPKSTAPLSGKSHA